MPKFEVGCAYKHRSQYFLADTKKSLVHIKKGKLSHRKPIIQYENCRKMTVEELCLRWGVTLNKLDELLGHLFNPTSDRTKPRGRRAKTVIDDEYRQLRTARVLFK